MYEYEKIHNTVLSVLQTSGYAARKAGFSEEDTKRYQDLELMEKLQLADASEAAVIRVAVMNEQMRQAREAKAAREMQLTERERLCAELEAIRAKISELTTSVVEPELFVEQKAEKFRGQYVTVHLDGDEYRVRQKSGSRITIGRFSDRDDANNVAKNVDRVVDEEASGTR